jgi:hypothetical protein
MCSTNKYRQCHNIYLYTAHAFYFSPTASVASVSRNIHFPPNRALHRTAQQMSVNQATSATLLCLWRLFDGLSSRSPTFDLRAFPVRFVVEKVTQAQEYFGCPLSLSFHHYSILNFILNITLIRKKRRTWVRSNKAELVLLLYSGVWRTNGCVSGVSLVVLLCRGVAYRADGLRVEVSQPLLVRIGLQSCVAWRRRYVLRNASLSDFFVVRKSWSVVTQT